MPKPLDLPRRYSDTLQRNYQTPRPRSAPLSRPDTAQVTRSTSIPLPSSRLEPVLTQTPSVYVSTVAATPTTAGPTATPPEDSSPAPTMASSGRNEMPNVKAIPYFYSNKSSPEVARKFLETYDSITASWDSSIRATFMGQRLKGKKAMSWWSTLPLDTPWDQLKNSFETNFVRLTAKEIDRKYKTAKRLSGESVDSWALRYKALAKEAGITADQPLLQGFLSGLRSKVHYDLYRSGDYADIDDLIYKFGAMDLLLVDSSDEDSESSDDEKRQKKSESKSEESSDSEESSEKSRSKKRKAKKKASKKKKDNASRLEAVETSLQSTIELLNKLVAASANPKKEGKTRNRPASYTVPPQSQPVQWQQPQYGTAYAPPSAYISPVVNTPRRPGGRGGQGRPTYERPSGPRGIRLDPDVQIPGGELVCGRCYYRGHGRDSCRRQGLQCQTCGQWGHIRVECESARPYSFHQDAENTASGVSQNE